jgi:hypothetical protein
MQPIVLMELIKQLIIIIYIHGYNNCYLVKLPQK